ncbi:MAG TPA: transglutaminase family protein [Polyangia bacterium]|jgi:transglutaminase-like putative cysteine protease|nr:transglutaminase family protein [Polyangia bacterium]
MRQLHIDHVTEYRFGAVVTPLPHRLRLRPRENHNLRIVDSKLEISPAYGIRWQRDVLDNSVAVITFADRADRLRIESTVLIEHYEEAPLDFLVEDFAVRYPFQYQAHDVLDLAPFCTPTWPGDHAEVMSWLGGFSLGTSPIETFLLLDRLNHAIRDRFRYQVREQPGVQSPRTTLTNGSGSCRDLAAFFMESCRHLGLASRFVTGYNLSYADVGNGSTHAWAEVYLPGPGWKGFDPTAGVVAGSSHIAVAVAHHPETVPPVAGSFLGPRGIRPQMHVTVGVREAAATAGIKKSDMSGPK